MNVFRIFIKTQKKEIISFPPGIPLDPKLSGSRPKVVERIK